VAVTDRETRRLSEGVFVMGAANVQSVREAPPREQRERDLREARPRAFFLASDSTESLRREESGVFAIAQEEDEDRRLVRALLDKDDDPAAWRAFQRRFDRLVLRCITKVTKRFATVSSEDVREIYAQLYLSLVAHDRAKLRAFDPSRGSRLSSYVGMLAMHCAYDWLRSMRREPQRETLAEAADLTSDTPDPFELAVQQERAELAARVLEGFSERDRTFAALYFGEGMEPHEIARSMKISVKTVYSKKHKIKAKLEAIVAALRGGTLAA
jgi:RNA polymerase sigma-70 factor (ECF subfamily)